MRLTHLVRSAGCASKLGPMQLAEVLRHVPRSANPNLVVGFETSDDAGVYKLSEELALVQTVDFFTPIVDDPYSYGQIAAANALSDVYAMGGRPITVLNVACFSPQSAPPETWAEVLRGAYEKTEESGAVVVGGHSVEDEQPKFGMAVTGFVDPRHMFENTAAKPGDEIWLTKPLGTGIVTTAAKFDDCSAEALEAAIRSMSTLNRLASERGLAADVRCATDITGFSLAGHLTHISKASNVALELYSESLPLLPGVERMIADKNVTAGGKRNAEFVGERITFAPSVPEWLRQIIFDPQTSGGLALFSRSPIEGGTLIGRVLDSGTGITVR